MIRLIISLILGLIDFLILVYLMRNYQIPVSIQNLLFMLFFIFGIISYLFFRSYERHIIKRSVNFPNKVDSFYQDIENLNEAEFFEKFMEEYNNEYYIFSHRLVELLIIYKHISTLKYVIKCGANISGNEQELEKLLPKTYTKTERYKEDFVYYFADRL